MEENVTLEYLYEKLYRIRKVEERIVEIYPTDKIKSPCHLSIGQEHISVVVCENLKKEDVIFGSHRSHAPYLAKGGDLKKFFAELYGKETGCCKGRGGSMHLIDIEAGVMGTSAIVASTIPEAVGYAYAMKLKNKNVRTVAFFGDGATEEGVFFESVNFAVLHELNIVFVCENNGKSSYSNTAPRSFGTMISKVLPWEMRMSIKRYIKDYFNNADILYFYNDIGFILKHYEYPIFIEVITTRLKEHVGVNIDDDYKIKENLDEFNENDIIPKTRLLINNPEEIENKVNKEIEEAIEFAENSKFPSANKLYEYVW